MMATPCIALSMKRSIRTAWSAPDADRGQWVITSLDTSAFSIGETISEAVDFQLDYRIATRKAGDFRLSSSVTWQPLLKRGVEPYNEKLNVVGADLEPLAWRGTASLEWSRGRWLLGLAADFYDHYRVVQPEQPKYRADQLVRSHPTQVVLKSSSLDSAGTSPSDSTADRYRITGDLSGVYRGPTGQLRRKSPPPTCRPSQRLRRVMDAPQESQQGPPVSKAAPL